MVKNTPWICPSASGCWVAGFSYFRVVVIRLLDMCFLLADKRVGRGKRKDGYSGVGGEKEGKVCSQEERKWVSSVAGKGNTNDCTNSVDCCPFKKVSKLRRANVRHLAYLLFENRPVLASTIYMGIIV